MPQISYPVFTVVVYAGKPTALHLTESYRRSFERKEDAERYARTVTHTTRMNWQQGTRYVPPCASVFEDSPSRGIGAHLGEWNSPARSRFLRRVANGQVVQP